MSSIYVGLSMQMAAERRMTTIASNIANMNTPGYRAEEIKFETLLSKAANDVAFVSEGDSYTSLRPGNVSYTGNPLDLAPQGDAWFAVRGPSGTMYTRDGRFQLGPNGDLRTVDNLPVLDAGGTQITIDASQGPVTVGADGAITQAGNRIGTVGLFNLPADAVLTRHGASAVVPDRPATVVQDFGRFGIRQGYVEGSNVDPIMEMTRLIAVQRSFEMAAQATQQGEDSISEAVNTLGPS